ncbi:uncharacterized protein SAPINGB_P002798 [Magnusiomyces paraingens]|uniref:nitric oxide dioxygenase n=1 Tax=Magnusiomyces paraingens TaxID=2606893 RepID=A0A5E8BP44_9ASCO|nr:uncharacterized protein SAPINGB_P002798 [Saprochaete ingens]VVT50543.1 unnamed protein product [Saprochaete ingens]
MPLTPEQVNIIKACIPILKEGGVTLTTRFYQNMLSENPEVKGIFNQAHQATGAQPRALAHALLLYATYIDDLSKLTDLVERITAKHVVLNVQPEGYAIVGKYLIATMKEVLGEDVATPAVLEAWTAAYTDLAGLLIGIEEKMYEAGEWRGYRDFIVQQKIQETPNVVSLVLAPKDGRGVKPGKPGQYIGIKLNDEKYFANSAGTVRREYTLSDIGDGKTFRISVKKIPNGKASGFIHESLKVGDVVEIAPPEGDFVLAEPETTKNIIFIAGGIGITPIISLSKQVVSQYPNISATLVHAVHDPEDQPFTKELSSLEAESKGKYNVVSYYSKLSSTEAPNKTGHITSDDIKKLLPTSPEELQNTHVYYLGPLSFMTDISKYLSELNVEHTHREFFLPDQSLIVA